MDAKQKERASRILPNGKPRYIRCYDNGGETIDRYTCVFTGNYNNIGKGRKSDRRYDEFIYLGMSGAPFHPQGFGQHGSSVTQIDRPKYSHLGKKVQYDDLPSDVQLCIMQTYLDIWNFIDEDGFWLDSKGRMCSKGFVFSNGIVQIPK